MSHRRPRSLGATSHAGLAALLLALAAPALLAASPKAIYRRCEAAVVEVLVDSHHAGSGWFATPEGLILTAAHLFDHRTSRVDVVTGRGSRHPCRLLALNRGDDVALLETSEPMAGSPTLLLAARPLEPGDVLFQFGAPIYRNGVLQTGRVARRTAAFEFYGPARGYVRIRHVSAMMQGGTSGGPWLDSHGRVVGLQSGTMSLDGKPVGIAYLVETGPLREILRSRRDGATPDPGLWVDHLWERDASFAARFPPGIEGLIVSGVRDAGPAARAGLKPEDLLLETDGRALLRVADLLEVIRSKRPGDPLPLRFVRGGESERRTVTLTLGNAEQGI
ncbi:MAG TPA: S1C family serine protease [Verrucomicrobiota bacterium]|nr:S1C family serine protease [Verrucomicrobiota bacterium]HNU51899.1 S1C family serine protease [Verrucomicrobiota bacterium]